MCVLIISDSAEKSINDVLMWLAKNKFVRITNFIQLLDSLETINFYIDNKNVTNLNQFSTFWLRKGHLPVVFPIQFQELNDKLELKNYFFVELEVFKHFLIQQLEEKKHLGNYFLQIPNKLNHLYLAQKSGLEIPKTTITNNKEVIKSFKNESLNIINKSLSDSFKGIFDQIYYYNHTERVSKEVTDELEDSFFPSLFQEELQKTYELRIVFVQENLWAMAIFSQNDKKTEVDWRNYNHERPNRKIPFKLPLEIENNIRKFIKASGLNTGAIDMVVTKDKKYVFLECNPNGQISMVSEHCNYYIEKYIAEYLSTS